MEENPSSPLSKISGKLSLANEGSKITCFQVSIQTQSLNFLLFKKRQTLSYLLCEQMLCCLLEAAGLEADFSCSCRMKSTSPLCSRVAIQNLLGSNERRSHQFHAVFAALQRNEQQTETQIMPRLQGGKCVKLLRKTRYERFNQI